MFLSSWIFQEAKPETQNGEGEIVEGKKGNKDDSDTPGTLVNTITKLALALRGYYSFGQNPCNTCVKLTKSWTTN